MPLLEGCVASSVRVGERLGVQRPWEPKGRECKPWSKEEESDPIDFVDRFLNDDLCVEKPKESLLWRIVKPIVLINIKLYMFTVSTIVGLSKLVLG
jgi:hypothetical protein